MKSFHQIPRRVVIVSAVLLCVVAVQGIVPWRLVAAEAQPAADKPPGRNVPVKLTPVQEKIFQALQEKTHMEVIETPLRHVANSLKDLHKIDLRFDEEAQRQADLDRYLLVTANLNQVNLNNALWLVLREHGLTHVIRGDTLWITTPPAAQRMVQQGGINPDGIKMWSANSNVVNALGEPSILEFIETPLQDIIDYLRDLHRVDIRIDEQAFREARLGSDTPLTTNLSGVTFNSALRFMLCQIGATHVVSHGVLLITTPQHRDRLVQQGAFDPDDLRFSPGNNAIFPALAAKTKLEFINTPLMDVTDFLQDLHSTKIKFDERSIDKAGLVPYAPVTKRLVGVTLHSALKDILEELGLAHVVQYEVILITSVPDSRRRLRSGALAPTDAAPDPPVAAVEALQQLVAADCREQPLSQVVKVLQQQGGVHISIDDWELARLGLKRDLPCTLNVKGMPLQAALKRLLDDTELGYFIEDDLLVIASPDTSVRRRQRVPRTVVYDLMRKGAEIRFVGTGDDAYVAGVYFRQPHRITDDVLADMKALPRLRRLSLVDTNVTDSGLVHLKNFPELQELDLRGIVISDAGLGQIAALQDLCQLRLGSTQVSDAGLKNLQGLTHLRSLEMACPSISNAGAKHLTGLTQLTHLHLPTAGISDAGLKHIAGLPELIWLDLRQTRVTGAGLSYLRGSKLGSLYLDRSPVNGAGLADLKYLTRLTHLRLSDTQITDSSLRHLRAWLEAVGAAKATGDDPFAGEPRTSDDPFAGEPRTAVFLTVQRTKLTRTAIAALERDFTGLHVSGD